MQLSQKRKIFSQFFFFFQFQNLDSILNILKKKMTLIADIFLNLGIRKTWEDKHLKSSVSEDPSASDMGNAPKHFGNRIETAFTIFIDHCEVYSVGKGVC